MSPWSLKKRMWVFLRKTRLPELVPDAAYVPVHVLDHGAGPGVFPPRALLQGGDVRDVLPHAQGLRVKARHVLRRREVGVVRRLHGQHREKRGLCRGALLQVLQQKVRQAVRLVSRQPAAKGRLALPAVDPAVVLAVVVLIPHPLLEVAAPLGRDRVQGRAPLPLVEAVQVPLAEVRGVVAVFVEHVGDGRHLRRHLVLVAGHALVRVAAWSAWTRGTGSRADTRSPRG